MALPSLVVGTNTLITLAEHDAYALGSARAAEVWDFAGVNAPRSIQYIITAMRILSRYRYEGTRTVSTQALPFPRNGLTNLEDVALVDNTTPNEIKWAQSELAISLAEKASLETDTASEQLIKSVNAQGTSVSFFAASYAAKPSALPAHILQMIRPFLHVTSGTYSLSKTLSPFDCASTDITGVI